MQNWGFDDYRQVGKDADEITLIVPDYEVTRHLFGMKERAWRIKSINPWGRQSDRIKTTQLTFERAERKE